MESGGKSLPEKEHHQTAGYKRLLGAITVHHFSVVDDPWALNGEGRKASRRNLQCFA